jgi:hypothetical protein
LNADESLETSEDMARPYLPPLEAMQEVKRVKVARTCPRCRTHAYHYGNDFGLKNRISCVNCGHAWIGRITKEEQS